MSQHLRERTAPDVDAVVVGAGFAGLYTAYKLRELGFSFQVLEAAGDVGGTWYWNRYPGARCDIESVDYTYSFSEQLHQEWNWSERYATQPEILRYANFVADRLDLRRHITFDTQVTSMVWSDDDQTWTVTTKAGGSIRSRVVVTAVGLLSASNKPSIKGYENFRGRILHTGSWPHEPVDFTGRRVAVIGTGSSGIQVIPEVAAQAAALTVFQRTANFSIPAHNRPLTAREIRRWKSDREFISENSLKSPAGYYTKRATKSIFDDTPEDRQAELERRWAIGGFEFVGAYTDPAMTLEANAVLADFVRDKIRSVVEDPEVAAKLVPYSHPFMAKRPTVNTNYYQTYNRSNVHLVDLHAEPIQQITEGSIRTSAAEYEIDDLVLATGFDAVSGPYLRMGIRGSGGVSLNDAWAEGAQSYLGITIAGFPNLFTVTGPLSATPLTNVIRSIEHHVDWIGDCLSHMRDHDLVSVVATGEGQARWDAMVAAMGEYTVHAGTASWYTGGNIDGKPRKLMAWVAGLDTYADAVKGFTDNDYEGFEFTRSDDLARSGADRG